MNTVAWVLVLVGVLTLRQVSRGRTLHIGEDLSDALLALVRGDTASLTAVLARTGTGNAPVAASGDVVGTWHDGAAPTDLAAAAVARGQKAKGYRWGGTGPDYYDCSGLIWRACQDIGYTGGRFSTATIRGLKGFKVVSAPGMQMPAQKPVPNAKPGDIVLWPAGSGGVTGHMGVMTAPDRFYSARSVRSGIGESTISGFRKPMPIYLRYTP